MDLDRIRELLQVVAESGVSEVEIEEDGLKLVVRRNAPSITMQPAGPAYPYGAPYGNPYGGMPMPPAPMAAPPPAVAAPAVEAKPEPTGMMVRAPIVGTFYRAPSPESDPYVEVGSVVRPGDVLCIIEAMKLMNEIECEVAGTIREILVDSAQAVEFDQPLFVIEPA